MKIDNHFLAWTLIFALTIWISNLIIINYGFSNTLIGVIIAGFILTFISWIMYSILYGNQFLINGWFILWVFTHSISFWLIGLILGNLLIAEGFIYFIIYGFLINIFTSMVKHKIYDKNKIKKKNKKIIAISIILITILVMASALEIPGLDSNIKNGGSFSGNPLIEKIKEFFSLSSFLVGKNCPQINVPMISSGTGGGKKMGASEYDGWKIRGYSLYSIYCYKGNEKGENPNYWYCGDLKVTWGENADYGLMQKTLINSDRTIGKTIRKSFSNIYDENENFIKTVCGEDPDKLAEGEFKEIMTELDNFF